LRNKIAASLRLLATAALVALLAFAAACGDRAGAAAASDALRTGDCDRGYPAGTRCSWLSVYENRESRIGRTIELRIAVLPAYRASARDPIFFLAGGPGQAAAVGIHIPWLNELRAERDVVLVDQRGTGGSNGLICQFYGPAGDLQSYFREFLPLDQVKACRDRLERSADLKQYTTAASVEDLEDVRRALGYERINLVGGSYGTRLAMEYVRRHGSDVRSVILEGVAHPAMHMPDRFGELAQRALDALLTECEQDAACGKAFPDVRNAARTVFERLAAAPVQTRVTHPRTRESGEITLTRDHVAESLRYMMYSSRQASEVPLALTRARAGDYQLFAERLLRRRLDGQFEALYLSATCTEDVPFVPADSESREAATYMAGYRLRQQRAACGEWPRGAAPDWIGKPVQSDVPTLLISGALDPVTPPEIAERVLAGLTRGRHIVVPFGAHSPDGLSGVECINELRRSFISDGHAGRLDTSCVKEIRRPKFSGT
jgi:pimeloyl-ACP methyl ester carboxylesterase